MFTHSIRTVARCVAQCPKTFATSTTRHITTERATKNALRKLLRETAQPVAVVTSLLDIEQQQSGASSSSRPRSHPFHGATLSSFSSIALDPHPLVSFSLRVPSRLATSLKAVQQKQRNETHMVVNILSSQQQDIAIRFSRADLYEDPLMDTRYHLSEDGLPILTGCLGALTCSLVKCIPLHELCDSEEHKLDESGVISELFIARVVRVENPLRPADASPLLYHHQLYATPKLLDPWLHRNDEAIILQQLQRISKTLDK